MRLVQEIEGVIYCGEVSSLPGCPDIAVSHAVYCINGRGSGKGTKANLMRLSQLKELGYSAVLCTVCIDNTAQRIILQNAKWTESLPLTNNRTGHTLIVYTRQL